MAFIELTEDEIAVLSETEKKQYDRQLRLHRERIAFVEKLEKIESANYQYQKPKIKRIKPVRRIELPKYKAISDVKITVPENLVNRRDIQAKSEAQQALTKKISDRIVSKCKISQLPALDKVKLPSPFSYRGTKKIEISTVSEKIVKPNVPVLSFKGIENFKIKNVPQSKNITAPDVSFEYERKPLNMTLPKIPIPSIKKFTGLDAVNINNIPRISVSLATSRKYTPVSVNAQSISEVSEKATSVNIKSPMISYEVSKTPNVIVPKIRIAANQSAARILDIKKHMAGGVKPSVSVESIKVNLPKKTSIESYKPSKFDVHVPQIKATILPDMKKVQVKPVDINVEIKPQGVETPTYTVSPIKQPEVAPIEVVKVNVFHFTDSDAANVIKRVLNGI